MNDQVELTEAQKKEIASIQNRAKWLNRFIVGAGMLSTGYSVGTILAKFFLEGDRPTCDKD